MPTSHTNHHCPKCGHKLKICGYAYIDAEDMARIRRDADKALGQMMARRRPWWRRMLRIADAPQAD